MVFTSGKNLSPQVSIVIPTRNRISTLSYTIETTLQQTVSAGYEVIVSDNGDAESEQVRDLVRSYHDTRLVFVKTPKYLSMCDSWEFALDNASGQIICFIGDDDGLMPNAVEAIIDADQEYSPDVFFWREHCFGWPGTISSSGTLISLSKRCDTVLFDPMPSLEKIVKWGGSGLTNIPMIYHSAVSRNIINKVKSRVGRYFESRQPDIFPAFASIFESTKCVRIGSALTVSGWSSTSNSGSMRNKYSGHQNKSYIEAYKKWKLHDSLVENQKLNFFYATAESILMAVDFYPSKLSNKFNFNAMWAIYIRLSGYQNYFWLMKNWKSLTKRHDSKIILFHLYLILNIMKTIYDYTSVIFGIKNTKIDACNVLEFTEKYK